MLILSSSTHRNTFDAQAIARAPVNRPYRRSEMKIFQKYVGKSGCNSALIQLRRPFDVFSEGTDPSQICQLKYLSHEAFGVTSGPFCSAQEAHVFRVSFHSNSVRFLENKDWRRLKPKTDIFNRGFLRCNDIKYLQMWASSKCARGRPCARESFKKPF